VTSFILAQVLHSNSTAYQSGRAAGSLAGAVCMFFFIAAVICFMDFIWGTIFKKAGYNFWMGILMIIPLVNLIWIIIFAFSKWPILQELEARGGHPGFPVTPPPGIPPR
jgi:hypothetical protein